MGVRLAHEGFRTITTYYKTKSPAASVCLLALNSKSTGRIFIQFSTTGRVILEEGLVYNKFRFVAN